MKDPIQKLYETHGYPAMSHPLSDPAVSAVAASLAGLTVRHPSRSRVLEIGCSGGHNLIPLAMRWPGSRFVGIDLSEPAIRQARELASAASVNNVEFQALDLRDFESADGGFDFIIAHGFFSWVPDEVKSELFTCCQQWLAIDGIATISFNLECGWLPRIPVIEKVRAIQKTGAGDEMSALAVLRTITDPDSQEWLIINDMVAKGREILPFDDFAPVNDPWPLDRFVRAAAGAGLRWLGESDPGRNLPSDLGAEVLDALCERFSNPLDFQMAVDHAAKRTFRSGLLCRNDASIETRFSMKRLMETSVRIGSDSLISSDQAFMKELVAKAPSCVSVSELLVAMPEVDHGKIARELYKAIQLGDVLPRIEPVDFRAEPPERPELNGFRLECARRGLPLVDIWHRPCSFPPTHYAVLAAMDGTQRQASLEELARGRCPDLDFRPWLRHLAGRGMFA